MKITACLILYSLTIGFSVAQEEAKENRDAELPGLQELGRGLASDNFEERVTAGEAIWQRGEGALDFLLKLEGSDDPEIAARATRLRHKIRCGILPDTPPEIVTILEGYLTADATAKRRIANELREGQHFEYILRLHNLEQNEEIKAVLHKMVNDVIPSLIKKYIAQDNMPEVRKLLRLANDFSGKIRYASFLQLFGELDEEITRLQEMDDEDSKSRYLAALRVKGDLPLLKKEAIRLEETQLAALASLLMGDAVPYLKSRKASKENSLVHEVLLSLLIARAEGNSEGVDKMSQALRRAAGKETDPSEQYYARVSLYAAGLMDDAAKLADASPTLQAYEHYLITDQEEKAPALFGIGKEGVTTDWLNKNLTKMISEWGDKRSDEETTELIRNVCVFYENRGDYKTVSRILKAVFDASRRTEDRSNFDLCEYFLEELPRGSLEAIAREIDEFEVPFGELIQSYSEGEDNPSLLWVFNEIKKADPDVTTLQLLQLVTTYNGSGASSREEFERWNKILLERVKKSPEEEKVRLAGYLDSLWVTFGPASGRWDLLNIPEYLESRESNAARMATSLGLYEDAAALFQEVPPRSHLQTDSGFLIRKSLSLGKNGRTEEASEIMKMAQLYGGGTRQFHYAESYYQLEYGNHEASYDALQKTILRLGEDSSTLAFYLNRLLTEAIFLERWKNAAALAELTRYLIISRGASYTVLNTFKADFTKGMALLVEGKKAEAIVFLEQAHSHLPANGSLADDFFPALRKHGLNALHDRLCQKTLGLLREKVRYFPTDHSARNTFAWVASRANRNLAEAETMITRGLKGDPLSPALMDTYAEVKFAQGNREEAVKWSKQAVDYRISDSQIRDQLRRFRSGEFPAP
ncbi:MAG: hypothetical protein ACON5H_02110 [Akkermansiaceae bacterium]